MHIASATQPREASAKPTPSQNLSRGTKTSETNKDTIYQEDYNIIPTVHVVTEMAETRITRP